MFAENNTDRLPSSYIVGRLNDEETRRWVDFNRGKGMTTRDLAAILRRYGVQPQNLRTKTGVVKGYLRSDLDDQFSRYLETSATALQHAASIPITNDQAIVTPESLGHDAFSPYQSVRIG